MFYSIYIMTIANKDERALFYFFLLYLTLTFAYGFDVHFEIRCDDYCIRVLDGSTVVKNMKNYFSNQNGLLIFQSSFTLANSISIVVQNAEGSLSLCGKVDFDYFFLSTNHINLWTIDLPGEACYGEPFITNNINNGFYVFEIININHSLNYKECTFTLSLDICKNNVYYIKIDETRELDYIDMLNVEKNANFG